MARRGGWQIQIAVIVSRAESRMIDIKQELPTKMDDKDRASDVEK
jgi:hypothetical protein